MGSTVGAEVLHRLRPVESSTRPWPGLLLHGWIGELPDRIVLLRPYRSLVCSKLDYGCLNCLWTGWSEGYEDPIHHQGLPLAFHAISDQSLYVKAMGLTQHSWSDEPLLIHINWWFCLTKEVTGAACLYFYFGPVWNRFPFCFCVFGPPCSNCRVSGVG